MAAGAAKLCCRERAARGLGFRVIRPVEISSVVAKSRDVMAMGLAVIGGYRITDRREIGLVQPAEVTAGAFIVRRRSRRHLS